MEQERAVSVQLAAARIDGLVRRDLAELREIAQALAEGRTDQLQPQEAPLSERRPGRRFLRRRLPDGQHRPAPGRQRSDRRSPRRRRPSPKRPAASARRGRATWREQRRSLWAWRGTLSAGRRSLDPERQVRRGAILFGVIRLADSGFVAGHPALGARADRLCADLRQQRATPGRHLPRAYLRDCRTPAAAGGAPGRRAARDHQMP